MFCSAARAGRGASVTSGEAALLARIGAEVRRRRTALGLSQEAFAERSGHHRTFVGALEQGQMNVSIVGLDRIAGALGCRLVDLLAELSDVAVEDSQA